MSAMKIYTAVVPMKCTRYVYLPLKIIFFYHENIYLVRTEYWYTHDKETETDLLQRFRQANEVLVLLVHPEGRGDCFVGHKDKLLQVHQLLVVHLHQVRGTEQ